MSAEIAGRRIEYETPWLAVEAKDVRRDQQSDVETWYSIRTHDYAAVLAVTEDGRIPLVRQYRPAIEVRSLELPSGLIEPGEDPADAIRRELLEETGCDAAALEPLGRFDLDSGRMQTAQWCFFARNVRVVAPGPTGDEPDLELLFVRADELRRLALDGEFRMAGHLALLAAALLRGLLE
jgi:ADP-ribose pyrophosphatase